MSGGLKPYSATKDSSVPWLGDIPEHWDVLPARAVYKAKVRRNLGMSRKTVLSLSYGRIVVKPEEKIRGLVPESFETYQLVDPGDIIIRTTDLQNDRSSLRIAMSNHQGIITSAYMSLVVTDRLLPEFGYQFLNAYDLLKIIYGFGSGLRQSLDFSDIKQMPVLAPPVDDQAAIVRYLDHADRRIRRYITAKNKLIALLNEQKQAIIDWAVTRGINPDVNLKASGLMWIGDVPAHWRAHRLKEVSRVQTGVTLGKNYGNAALVERPYLRVANVQAGHLDLARVTTVRVPAEEAARSTLQAGDVLMTEGGDIDKLGRGCVWRGEVPGCLHQNHVFAVRPRPAELLPQFLAALMGSPHGRNYFQMTAKQTTNLAATNSTTLGNFPMLLPGVDEQEDILARLDELLGPLEAAMNRALQQIDFLREYRVRLIADVVTGKLDVREAAARLQQEVEELQPIDDAVDVAEADETKVDADPDATSVEVVA